MYVQDLDSVENDDSSVIRCLQDYVEEITDSGCKDQVCTVVVVPCVVVGVV